MRANTSVLIHSAVLIGILAVIFWDANFVYQRSQSLPDSDNSYLPFVNSTYLCYSPFIRGETPTTGQAPPTDVILKDLTLLFSNMRFRGLRIYSPNYPTEFFDQLESNQVDLIMSVDLTNDVQRNAELFEQTKVVCKRYSNIKMLLIGNEYLRNNYSLPILQENLIKYKNLQTNLSIEEGPSKADFLISEGDIYDSWMTFYPQLNTLVDCIALQIYSYSGLIDQDVSIVYDLIKNVSETYPTTDIFITELGFPSVYNGQIQDSLQAQYYDLFYTQFKTYQDQATKPLLGVTLFEFSDEWWKDPKADLYNNNGYPDENFGLVTESRNKKAVFNYFEGHDVLANDSLITPLLILGICGITFTYVLASAFKKRKL